MKKKIIIITIISLIVLSITAINLLKPKEKQDIYLFWGEGCHHCEALKEYLNTIPNKYQDKYNLVKYEVFNSEENYKKMQEYKEKYNIDQEGVPFLVIGEDSYLGFSESLKEEILESIKSL